MERKDLIKSMKAEAGAGFITRQGLSRFMGVKDPRNVDKYLAGLERVSGKYYFIPDVADSLIAKARG